MIQSWNCCQFCPQIVLNLLGFFVNAKKLSSDLETPHFPTFLENVANSQLEREMVMENQEMVMEKSLKNILSSL